MKKSRYEEVKQDALKAIHCAICENNYYNKNEYIIAIQNVTDGYNVDFTHTDDGEWADEVFEQSFELAVDCAHSHHNTVYFVILARSFKSGNVKLIEKRRICVL